MQRMEEVDCLAVDGVFREPFSDPISLLTGKNTGKIWPFTLKSSTGESDRHLNRRGLCS